MLVDQFLEAAASAKNTHAIDEVARLTWKAQVEGHLAYSEAEAVSEALQARRKAFAAGQGLPAPKAIVAAPRPARRPPRSPDRRRSLERRRRQAMSGIVPARIASAFTIGELAVLTVVGREIQRHGTCALHVDAIAALAGVCRTTVKRALRQARLMGVVLVKERRIPGRKSLTNIVSVASAEWRSWLRLGIGGQIRPTPADSRFKERDSAPLRGRMLSRNGPPSGRKEAFEGVERLGLA